MINDKKIKIKINSRNKTYYNNKGYNTDNSEIEIDINDLNPGSITKINVSCDNCGEKKNMEYRYYINNLKKYDKYYCNKCKHIKSKITKKEKYGDENYNNNEKYKQTMINKYGVEFPFQNQDIFNKMLKTKKEKYDDENYNNIIKSKTTKKEKYGNENYNNKVKNLKTFNNNLFNKIPNLINITDLEYEIYCDKCKKNYIINKKNYIDRKYRNRECCTNCNPLNKQNSELENNLFTYIVDNYDGEIIKSSREIINPYEIDIYLPDLNLAFEFNGVYWHNELYKDKNYHQMKINRCNKINIQLIHIYEDDWIYRQDIIKSMILNKLGKSKNRIYARKTKIKTINKQISDIFYEKNHIQGKTTYSINIGLFYDNELISLMSFKKNKDNYELVRFANKLNTNVIGGASKLLKYFIKIYNPEKIISFSNNDYSDGKLYEKLNFKIESKLNPDYSYIMDSQRKHKFSFRKNNLQKMGFNIKNKTEHEICLENKIYRIYDSGKIKWSLNL